MVNFQKMFESSEDFTISYNGKELYWCDRFPIKNGETVVISIESTNSPYKQGISIDVKGSVEILGKSYKKGKRVMPIFWEDAKFVDPRNIEVSIHTKEHYVFVQNIWEFNDKCTGKKIRESGVNGAAMIVEEIKNGRRYRCNDGDPDDDFDDIVFTITRKPGKS